MPRGGYRPGTGGARPGAGRPKKMPIAGAREAVRAAGESPLEYMLRVMNNPEADPARRDRMAQAAAPYVHGKPGEKDRSRKAERDAAAKDAATGKFAPPEPPKLIVNNG